MMPLTAGKRKFKIATGWPEVTYGQFMQMIDPATDLGNARIMFSILTGLTKRQVAMYDVDSIEDILQDMEWLKDPIDLMALPLPEFITVAGIKVRADIKINTHTAYQKIKCQKLLGADVKLIDILPSIISLYTSPAVFSTKFDLEKSMMLTPFISECSIVEVYPVCRHIYEQLSQILETEYKLFKPKFTDEEIDAGIEGFVRFDIFNSVDMLANGNLLQWEDVLQMDYDTFFTKLCMEHEKRSFQKRYYEIINKQAQQ